jgi:hypothetical protein
MNSDNIFNSDWFIHEIFQHLSVKNLLDLKSVNKFWNINIIDIYIATRIKQNIKFYLKIKFGDNYDRFIKFIEEKDISIRGPFILESINDRSTTEDLDLRMSHDDYKNGCVKIIQIHDIKSKTSIILSAKDYDNENMYYKIMEIYNIKSKREKEDFNFDDDGNLPELKNGEINVEFYYSYDNNDNFPRPNILKNTFYVKNGKEYINIISLRNIVDRIEFIKTEEPNHLLFRGEYCNNNIKYKIPPFNMHTYRNHILNFLIIYNEENQTVTLFDSTFKINNLNKINLKLQILNSTKYQFINLQIPIQLFMISCRHICLLWRKLWKSS